MAEPYVGEVRMFGGAFAPVGWALCNGQTLPISGNETLFTVLGTVYGGDGQTTFKLPDLQGRTPVHVGTNPTTRTVYTQGQTGGAETVVLTTGQVAAHDHSLVAAAVEGDMSAPTSGTGILSNSSTAAAADKIFAYAPYATGGPAAMASGVGPPSHGSQPHDNMQPFVAVTYIIATTGVFPARS